ncbi:hypothetical protein LCGC14_1468740 [marine sediment metagenome]|uniref:Uncharacterized protein n=1 Tax=marine sediment metagenome TaxID=412755 RepID=A0A0F9JCZ8_9ZZZZ
MEEVNITIKKIKSLEKIKSIVCNDCKEYHHISKEFFKIVGITDEDLDIVINNMRDNFEEVHYNHDIEVKEMNAFPLRYNIFEYPFDYIDSVGYNWDEENTKKK